MAGGTVNFESFLISPESFDIERKIAIPAKMNAPYWFAISIVICRGVKHNASNVRSMIMAITKAFLFSVESVSFSKKAGFVNNTKSMEYSTEKNKKPAQSQRLVDWKLKKCKTSDKTVTTKPISIVKVFRSTEFCITLSLCELMIMATDKQANKIGVATGFIFSTRGVFGKINWMVVAIISIKKETVTIMVSLYSTFFL